MASTIVELREHLFETLRALRDDKNPMDVDRAEAIAHVAQTIVNSGRLECDYLELLGGDGTGFCPDADQPRINGARNGATLVGAKIRRTAE